MSAEQVQDPAEANYNCHTSVTQINVWNINVLGLLWIECHLSCNCNYIFKKVMWTLHLLIKKNTTKKERQDIQGKKNNNKETQTLGQTSLVLEENTKPPNFAWILLFLL